MTAAHQLEHYAQVEAGCVHVCGPECRGDLPADGPRWEPDTVMVDAVLSGPKSARRMQDLSGPDRAWLVAGLTSAGMGAQEIADRTWCSLRLIRFIRALDMTKVCEWSLDTTGRLDRELSAERSEHALTRRELADARQALARMQVQRDQLLQQRVEKGAVALLPCGHADVEWNIYRYTDRSGANPRERVMCRECTNGRASRYRKRRKPAGQRARHTAGVTNLHDAQIDSAP